VTCLNCHNDVFLHHIWSDKRVSLYFILLASYGTDEYLACPICRSGLQVGPQHRAKVNEMKAATAVFRRGGVRQDYYLPTVERFWRTMGVPVRQAGGAGCLDGSAARRAGDAVARLAAQGPRDSTRTAS
jgi:hypothetical protein